MAIIVKRYRVRHNSVVYGPGQSAGQIIEGLSKKEEARLIAGSNGTIEKYVPPKVAKVVAEDRDPEKTGEKDPNVNGNASGNQSEGEAGGDGGQQDTGEGSSRVEEDLLNINPDDLIKTGKAKAGK